MAIKKKIKKNNKFLYTSNYAKTGNYLRYRVFDKSSERELFSVFFRGNQVKNYIMRGKRVFDVERPNGIVFNFMYFAFLCCFTDNHTMRPKAAEPKLIKPNYWGSEYDNEDGEN